MRKMLEHRNITDEERMDQLEANLKEAKLMAEDADRKYDEVMIIPHSIPHRASHHAAARTAATGVWAECVLCET